MSEPHRTDARGAAPLSPLLAAPFELLPIHPKVPPMRVGESPAWHAQEEALYWCDIDGRAVHRWDPRAEDHRFWPMPCEPSAVIPALGGGVAVAMRDGLWRMDGRHGRRHRILAAPYDSRRQRFNDGKADACGRLWIGTRDDAREPRGGLWRIGPGAAAPAEGDADGMAEGNGAADGACCRQVVSGLANVNGIGFALDGATLHVADTAGHALLAFNLDRDSGRLSNRRVWARFETAASTPPGSRYGGRPDGAAIDTLGRYWVAMYEGGQLLVMDPMQEGAAPQALAFPVERPTMPGFAGNDGSMLVVTSAADPSDVASRDPRSGCLWFARTAVPGLPAYLSDVDSL